MTTASAIGTRPKGKAWHSQSAEEALAHLGSSATGLSAQEAAQRLVADGPNELKEGKRISPLQVFLGQFKSLIIWMLIAAGVISGLLGEVVDAIAILAIVVLNAVIGFYQEFKAEKSIAALKKLTAPQASVQHNGQVMSISASGIVRVHPEILSSQRLPDKLPDAKTIWKDRYRSIVDLEEHFHRNGTRIIKVFLHQSKAEQRMRFLKRIDNPEKNWKLSVADIEERKLWEHYMQAYEACLSETSTAAASWYVVPADDKKNARLIISEIILDVFNGLKMASPKASAKRRQELHVIRKRLVE